MGSYTRAQVAGLVDHTLLKPEATDADIVGLLTEAAELGVYAVCISPTMVTAAGSLGTVPSSHRSWDSLRGNIFRRSKPRRPGWQWPQARRRSTW